MELKIYNPREGDFIQQIEWNFDELKKEITVRASEYVDLVYSDDQIKEAKKDRADMNKFKKALDDKKREVKKQLLDPYTEFEAQVKELIAIVDKAVDNIDSQIKEYEDQLRQQKEERCMQIWKDSVGDMDRILTFEKCFNSKWLNKTTPEKAIREEILTLRERVDKELKLVMADMSPFVFEMKEEYLKDFDFSAAMSLKQRLEETEKKKALFEEQERQRKAQEKERLARQAREVHEAGQSSDAAPKQQEEKKEKVIAVTFRVVARGSQFDALNEAIRMLKENSESVEMINKEVL